MHHSDQPPEFYRREAERVSLGSTGLFPQGKLDPTDQGELRLAVAHHNGKVVLNFGKPIAWIGFDKQQALDLARTIKERAQLL